MYSVTDSMMTQSDEEVDDMRSKGHVSTYCLLHALGLLISIQG